MENLKVWVVAEWWNHEGDMVLGVYSSEEAAQEAAEEFAKNGNPRADAYPVSEFTVQ